MNSRRFISAPQCPADTTGSSQLDKDVGKKAGLRDGSIANRPVELLVAWSKLDKVTIIAGVVTTSFRLGIIE
jgi:hypothetical protein